MRLAAEHEDLNEIEDSVDDLTDIEDSADIPTGVPIKLSGGLQVTIIKKAKKCVRQVRQGYG